MSIFFTANMLASSFAPLIAAGVFDGLDGSMGYAGWQWYVNPERGTGLLSRSFVF